MGLTVGGIKLLIKTIIKNQMHVTNGSVLTFGNQAVQANYNDLTKYFHEENYKFHKIPKREIELNPYSYWRDTVVQKVLFKMLGFSVVESIDIFPNENPTHIEDLNHPIPSRYHEKYDLIFDGGTMEHCFNIVQVLENTVRMLKPGGLLIHMVPFSNWIDHGFYTFSPTLFFDYYSINGFVDLDLNIFYYKHPNSKRRREYFVNYLAIKNILEGSFKYQANVWFSSKKSGRMKSITFPTQSLWNEKFGHARMNDVHKKQLERLSIERRILSRFGKYFGLKRLVISSNSIRLV
jgi:SAM-dependent methyltransferase